MKPLVIVFLLFTSYRVAAQEEGDTVYSRCPVAITDTSGYNNYFTPHQSATVKLEKIKGGLVITIQQRDQFFTMFFRQKKLDVRKYKIKVGANDKDELDAKYSFRSGGRASYVNVTSGIVDVTYNKESHVWNLKVDGMLSNLVERSVAYYKVKADFSVK
jgi:hypothetical protein